MSSMTKRKPAAPKTGNPLCARVAKLVSEGQVVTSSIPGYLGVIERANGNGWFTLKPPSAGKRGKTRYSIGPSHFDPKRMVLSRRSNGEGFTLCYRGWNRKPKPVTPLLPEHLHVLVELYVSDRRVRREGAVPTWWQLMEQLKKAKLVTRTGNPTERAEKLIAELLVEMARP